MKTKYQITLLEHEDGVSVSCPELPGCHSQGATVAEALANIRDAIRDYTELYGEPDVRCEVRELEMAVA
ncbi:MAG: type II toxin-antitoxin system HicB family antitoxin [Limisphaerales bacterium]